MRGVTYDPFVATSMPSDGPLPATRPAANLGRPFHIHRSQRVPRPLDEVFAFYANAENLELLTPQFLRFRILSPTPIAMGAGVRIDYQLSLFGVPLRWRTRITAWEPGVRFVDEQESGPYALWRHTHSFARDPAAPNEATLITDRVEYALSFGPLGVLAHALLVRRTLRRIFDYRRDAVERVFGA